MGNKALGRIATVAAGTVLTVTGLVEGAKAQDKAPVPSPSTTSTPDHMAAAPEQDARVSLVLGALSYQNLDRDESLHRSRDPKVLGAITQLQNAGLDLETLDFNKAAENFYKVYELTGIDEFKELAEKTRNRTFVANDVTLALDALKKLDGDIKSEDFYAFLYAFLALAGVLVAGNLFFGGATTDE